ncbi:MAG: type IV pilus modification PilV family protein [Candidatus Loosdrechtia sp.]|uniref:type IV pilus modification PilV family protein n=1 Tax=Candidatus Loosdrechtia sp. TaxID=3101272 RepID=UPI003A6F243A|nr:MAG: prepilin-type N-terminal cleavage/methylation domain-containing protein [Candidatus Jettenia sp. AMX2]
MFYGSKENKEGFTLIEVLVAIFVLAIGIFGVMALFPVGVRTTGKIARTTISGISAEIPNAYLFYKYPPEDTGGPDYSIRDVIQLLSGTDTPACYFYPDNGSIALTGNPQYGWNVAIVPVDVDTNTPGTATSILESYLFRRQTAIYKDYKINSGTAHFEYNSTTISGVSNIDEISVNDFICNAQNRIWYRITGVNRSANSVKIQHPYEYETVNSAPYYTTNTLVGLYNTLHTSHYQ